MSRRNFRAVLLGLIVVLNIVAPHTLQHDGSEIIWSQWSLFFLGCTIILDIALVWAMWEAGFRLIPNYMGPLALSGLIVLAFGIGKLAQDGVFERISAARSQPVAVAPTPVPVAATPSPASSSAPACDPSTPMGSLQCTSDLLGGLIAPLEVMLGLAFAFGTLTYLAKTIRAAVA